MLKLARTAYPIQNVEGIIPLNSVFLWMDLGRPEGILREFINFSFLPYGFPTLAIIVALTTYVQSKLTMPASTNPNDQSAMISAQMSIMMPIMLFMFSLSFASGISVYFITSNVLGIIQYAVTGRANWSSLLSGGDKNKKSSTKK
jgi:YidC/Oxa1 family membrane protein insertase